MTVAVWRGPGGTSSHPKSGNFDTAANWSGGLVPDASTHAILAAGKYAVTFNTAPEAIGSLDIGTGVTLTIDEQTAPQVYLELKGDSTNAGHLVVSGSALVIDSGASLLNFGELYAANGYYTPSVQGGGALINDGLITGGSPTTSSLLVVTTPLDNEADGVVNSRSGSRVTFSNTVDNAGLLSAIDGGLVNFTGGPTPGNTLNLGEGILTGGHWSSIGYGSTLNLYNSDIESLTGGAVVTLSGAQSSIGGEDASGVTQIDTSLKHIDSGSELHILGGRDYSTGQDLDISGLLELGGGTLASNGMTVHDDAGSELRGFGLVTSDIDMYGFLRAAKNSGDVTMSLSGHNNIYGALVGRGTLELSGGIDVLQSGSQVFVKDIQIDAGAGLQLGQDLVYDGKLHLESGGGLDLGLHVLRLTGKVSLDGGTVTPGRLQLEGAQVTTTGTVTIDSALRNNGHTEVKNGELAQFSAVNGVGEFHIDGSAKLHFAAGVGGGQTVFMDGAHAYLELGQSAAFDGTVSGFATGDTMDFSDVAVSGATLTWKADTSGGGMLTLVGGGERASIHLEGDYRRSQFHLANDGSGGTEVTYGAAAGTAPHAEAHWDAHGGLVI